MNRKMINKDFVFRSILMLVSVTIMGMGVAFLKKTGGGPDPCSALNYSVSSILGLSLGTYQLLFNVVLFIFLFKNHRSKFGLGTIGNMVLVGYAADLTMKFIHSKLQFIDFTNPIVNGVTIILALFIFTIAASTYLNCGLGTAPYDVLPFVIHEKIKSKGKKEIPFRFVRIAYDGMVTLIAFCIGDSVGIVTVAMVILLGPMVDLISKVVKK